MYEKFTDRARKAMQLANSESHRFNHEYIGTEHILLGLVKEGSGVAANVLKNLGVDLRKIRIEVEKLVQSGPDMVTMGTVPQTPRAKKVIEYAMEESHTLGHNYIGTEHILLGLVREEEGVAAQVLTNLGLEFEQIRCETVNVIAPGRIPPAAYGGNPFQKLVRRLFEKEGSFVQSPTISTSKSTVRHLVTVDIGNSQIKLGQFARDASAGAGAGEQSSDDGRLLPEPLSTLALPILHKAGLFDLQSLATWCEKQLSADTHWLVGSVHRGASQLLAKTLESWARHLGIDWSVIQLTNKDVPIVIRVDEPARVGIDRLLAAVAANRLRAPDRAAIVVDLGTAITVDMVEADGAFAGGAILAGIGMAGRALADQTDALPHIVLEHSASPPSPVGKSTKAAIEAGLYWGAVGAVGELVSQISKTLPTPPDIFITGGAGRTVADAMQGDSHVRYVPHLVLSGIVLVDERAAGEQAAN